MKNIFLLSIVISLGGCAFGSIARVNDLSPGMTVEQVKDELGNPDGSEFINGHLVLNYSLHKWWTGYIPHYLFFRHGKLVSWVKNMDEYYAKQKQWSDVADSMDENRRHREQMQLQREMSNKPVRTNCTSTNVYGSTQTNCVSR